MIKKIAIFLTFCGVAFASLKEAEEATKGIIDYTASTSTEVKEIIKADKATLEKKAEQNYSGAKHIYQNAREPSEKLKKQLLNDFAGVQHLFNNLQDATGVKCNFTGVQEYQEIKKEFYTEEQEEEMIEKRSCVVSAFDKEEVCEENLKSLECVQTLKTTCEKTEDKPPFNCDNCEIQKDKIIFNIEKGEINFFIEDKTRIKKMFVKFGDISSFIGSRPVFNKASAAEASYWISGALSINNFVFENFYGGGGVINGIKIGSKSYGKSLSKDINIIDFFENGKNIINGKFYGKQKKIVFYIEYETKKICLKTQDKWEEVCEKL